MPKLPFNLGPKADNDPEQDSPKPPTTKDLGFGSSIGVNVKRLINRDGSFNVRRTGVRIRDINPYVMLVTMPWWQLLITISLSYVLFNALFAIIYVIAGVEFLSGGRQLHSLGEKFAHAFFFSTQTFTTVGYGTISPEGILVNIISSFEAMTGLLGFALATGVIWGRFSRPTAKIGFSNHAIIAPYQDINSFQFRIVNRRKNELVQLEVEVVFMAYKDVNGVKKQVFHGLELERERVSLFPLSWTIVHPITKESPLYGKSLKDLEESDSEFVIIIKGYDDTFAQEIYHQSSYKWDEILFGARFVKIFESKEDGYIKLDLDKVSMCERANLNNY
jgi:inward rectifier potassium channel